MLLDDMGADPTFAPLLTAVLIAAVRSEKNALFAPT